MVGEEAEATRVTKINSEKVAASNEACLVQIYGPGIGKRWPLNGIELTIGRDPVNDIVVDLDNVSRRHCRFTSRDGKVLLKDLGSTNGTYLNDQEVRQETVLRSGDLVKVGGAIFKFLCGSVEALYYEEIYQVTICDGLTQIYNKRYFLEFLEREMARCHRYGRALSLLMFDIDHFKKINDEHGHLAGDYALCELAGMIKGRVRREECFARYGGEEFAIVLPETGLEKARTFAERLVKQVRDHTFVFENRTIPLTISVGVAEMSADMTEPNQFIKAADTQLYRAKREGRDRVCSPEAGD
jgi:two-component system cell cycle response regulator